MTRQLGDLPLFELVYRIIGHGELFPLDVFELLDEFVESDPLSNDVTLLLPLVLRP